MHKSLGTHLPLDAFSAKRVRAANSNWNKIKKKLSIFIPLFK